MIEHAVERVLPSDSRDRVSSRQTARAHSSRLVHLGFEPIGFDFLDQKLGFFLAKRQWNNCESNLSAKATLGGLVASEWKVALGKCGAVFVDLELETSLAE